jgi:hypothetical protein
MTNKTTDEQPKDEPVKWVNLVNEFGNTASIPECDLDRWLADGWKKAEG